MSRQVVAPGKILPNRPYLIADDREGDVIAALQGHCIDAIVQRLDVADFICSGECAVERKRGDDLVTSIEDGRFRDELTRLVETFARPVLVIEDLARAFSRGQINPASIYGALASAALRYRIPIIPTQHAADTALLLACLAAREQEARQVPAEVRQASKKLSPARRKAYFLEGLVNTGPEKVKILLAQFGTPGAVIEAVRVAEINITRVGKLKLPGGCFAGMKGIGVKWVVANQALLDG